MRVLQLVDSLALGGLERVAVDLANLQAGEGVGLLCASREAGPLRDQLAAEVDLLLLKRRSRLDLLAVERLARWAEDRRVDLIHAHGSSLLLANLAARRTRQPVKIIWHDHYGRWATDPRPAWLYRLLTRRVDGVISVNESLRVWSTERLGLPPSKCRYIANAVDCPAEPPSRAEGAVDTPITLACVANLRPQKDHENLLHAVAMLSRRVERPIRLQLIGGTPSEARREELQRCANGIGSRARVEFLGVRNDVPELLRAADIGVLSSSSEGLPLALLEYGCAALPVVSTAVGQIPQVVGPEVRDEAVDAPVRWHEGALLVPPADPASLAEALAYLIDDPTLRRDLGLALFQRVQSRHGLATFHNQVKTLYRDLLEEAA